MITTIQTLWELRKNKSEIARLTGHDWKTVDRQSNYLKPGKIILQKSPIPGC